MSTEGRLVFIPWLILGGLGLILWMAPAAIAALGVDWSELVETSRTIRQAQQAQERLDAQFALLDRQSKIKREVSTQLALGRISLEQAVAEFQLVVCSDRQSSLSDKELFVTQGVCRHVLCWVEDYLASHPEARSEGLLERLQCEARRLARNPTR